MRRSLFAALALAGLLGVLAPAASASEQVCNFGGQVSLVAQAGLNPTIVTEPFGPLTINRNQINTPPGQFGKNIASTCEP